MKDRRARGPRAARAGQLLYGALFVVGVPAYLVILSIRAEVPLPALHLPLVGVLLTLGGVFTIIWGMWDIRTQGRGLPMNAFPPAQLVTGGVYALVAHPIYVGFTLACAGIAIAAGSAAGLWLAAPLAGLGCVALVLGYERLWLQRVFGRLAQPLLGRRIVKPAVAALGLDRVWQRMLRAAEKLANSWKSYRVGPARVMNHAVFSGLAVGVGTALVVLAAGPQQIGAIALLVVSALLGAAVVGQLLVGSSNKLSRPFGYYGGVAGTVVAGLVLAPLVPSMLLILTAFCFAAPWTQAIGRLRCLVQGCCHGAPAPARDGIVVVNEHSRVCGIDGMCGQPIYPTQLYSIIGNVALGAALVGLWGLHAPMTLVAGVYLCAAGAIRFIEEAYRGEPLTKVVAGLHIYQWFAVAMFGAGAAVLLFHSPPVPRLSSGGMPVALVAGAAAFVVCAFAMSVDFPDSRVRFSRLSG